MINSINSINMDQMMIISISTYNKILEENKKAINDKEYFYGQIQKLREERTKEEIQILLNKLEEDKFLVIGTLSKPGEGSSMYAFIPKDDPRLFQKLKPIENKNGENIFSKIKQLFK